jgi:hypothetical protein
MKAEKVETVGDLRKLLEKYDSGEKIFVSVETSRDEDGNPWRQSQELLAVGGSNGLVCLMSGFINPKATLKETFG